MADEDTYINNINNLKSDIDNLHQQIERVRRQGQEDIKVDEAQKQRYPDQAADWDRDIQVKQQGIERQVASYENEIKDKENKIRENAQAAQREHAHDERIQNMLRSLGRFM